MLLQFFSSLVIIIILLHILFLYMDYYSCHSTRIGADIFQYIYLKNHECSIVHSSQSFVYGREAIALTIIDKIFKSGVYSVSYLLIKGSMMIILEEFLISIRLHSKQLCSLLRNSECGFQQLVLFFVYLVHLCEILSLILT